MKDKRSLTEIIRSDWQNFRSSIIKTTRELFGFKQVVGILLAAFMAGSMLAPAFLAVELCKRTGVIEWGWLGLLSILFFYLWVCWWRSEPSFFEWLEDDV